MRRFILCCEYNMLLVISLILVSIKCADRGFSFFCFSDADFLILLENKAFVEFQSAV